MTVHYSCPTCTCGTGRLWINVDAEFWPLVVELDQLIYDDYISRRTASRRARKVTT